ncbi:hypothetical protein QLL95_gp0090 [Cotonvirus japonicus]|uniref:Uncharacterized protein n=1 Tax=Cotonvirus japonicus TaxID=2811091 RepID=A0ABM7NQZ1_9VIRU|nr:hypothetical protein QLL95_gp0090 [Cotonvirus japonicus]BCS82579.1 hypothetical protein [Cotonvirus japonicus]
MIICCCDIVYVLLSCIGLIGLFGAFIGYLTIKLYTYYQKIFYEKIKKYDRVSLYIFGIIFGNIGIYLIVIITILITIIICD